jgi:hypothetical protein
MGWHFRQYIDTNREIFTPWVLTFVSHHPKILGDGPKYEAAANRFINCSARYTTAGSPLSAAGAATK